MAGFVDYRLPTVAPSAAPLPEQRINAPAAAFGVVDQEGPRLLQQGAAQLDRAGDNLTSLALQEARTANNTRVEQLKNDYITQQQGILYSNDDAFYRQQGQDAINGAQGTTDKLIALKDQIVGSAANDYQKERLSLALDAQLTAATGGMSRHVADQSMKWQASVAAGRQIVLKNQASFEYNNPQHIEDIASAAEATARQQAKQQGLTGTDAETAMVSRARSEKYSSAIKSSLDAGDRHTALALYSRFEAKLDAPDRDALGPRMKAEQTDQASDDLINSKLPSSLPPAVSQYRPQIEKAATDAGVRPQLALGMVAQESGGNPNAVSSAGAKGLTQLMPNTAAEMGVTNPHDAGQSIAGGVGYLKKQLDTFGGDERLALMAYNWGPDNVQKWVKAGSDPAKVPTETKNYVTRVQAFASNTGVGFDKANIQAVAASILNDPNATPEVKAAAYTKLQKQSTVWEAARTAQTKGLDDTFETVGLQILTNTYKPGTLNDLAQGYEAVGDKSKAFLTRMLASNEKLLVNFGQAPPETQQQLIALFNGKAKELGSAIISGNKAQQAEWKRQSGEQFEEVKTAIGNGVDASTLIPKAKAAVQLALQGGDPVKAEEMTNQFQGMVGGQAAGRQAPAAAQAVIGELRSSIEQGKQGTAMIATLNALMKSSDQTREALQRDPLRWGTDTQSSVGQFVPLNFGDAPDSLAATLRIRETQARRTEALSTTPTMPLYKEEVEALRHHLDTGSVEQKSRTLQSIASGLSGQALGRVATALAGPKGGDVLAKGYAAALGLYADGDPEKSAIADRIVRGVDIQKNMGENGKKAPVSSPAWQSGLQNRVGTTLNDMDPAMQGVVASAVAAVYTESMHRQGRQGETIDSGELDKAITSVLGQTVRINGQDFYPPKHGMDRYQVDAALRTLTQDDLPAGMRTTEGTEITADKIKTLGRFSNVADGVYRVRIPDPRRGGELSDVVNPSTGKAWTLDMRPLLSRGTMPLAPAQRAAQGAIGALGMPAMVP